MGSYNSQYESYYNSILNSTKRKISSRGLVRSYFIRSIKVQLIGTMVLFAIVMICKLYITPETKALYSIGKLTVDENYDYKALITKFQKVNLNTISDYVKKDKYEDIESKLINIIDTERAKFTGSKTIREEIDEFSAPVSSTSSSKEKELIFNVPEDTVVKAAYSGVIESVKRSGQRQQYIIIDHGNGIETKYSNIEIVRVKEGDRVLKGEVIGSTGDKALGLHFELIYMGGTLNPKQYLKTE